MFFPDKKKPLGYFLSGSGCFASLVISSVIYLHSYLSEALNILYYSRYHQKFSYEAEKTNSRAAVLNATSDPERIPITTLIQQRQNNMFDNARQCANLTYKF